MYTLNSSKYQAYYKQTVYSVLHLSISIFVALTFMRIWNSHGNTIVMDQNRTSRKETSFLGVLLLAAVL